MPTREGRSGRRRPRTAPDLSPESDLSDRPTSNSRMRTAEANRSSRGKRSGEINGGVDFVRGATIAEPELLSRYIPPDPWVSRVTLSPQAPPPAPAGSVPHGPTIMSHLHVNGGEPALGGGIARGGGGEGAAQGIAGLRNDGNWCYLNAMLQALARCAPFRAHLMECVTRADVAGRPCPLAYAMSELFKDMWSSDEDGRQVEVAADVLRALVKGNRWFAGNGQHDAHEALRSILNLLHEELRRPIPVLFEPGHTALAAAMAAASSAHNSAGGVAGSDQPPTPSADVNLSSKSPGGKATTPSTPAEGGWSGDTAARTSAAGSGSGSGGAGSGDKRSGLRVASGDQTVTQNDIYWQSTTTETFQGILLSRITCRACGRHSDQPDRFCDLSVPLMAAYSGSLPSVSSSGCSSPAFSGSPYPPQPHPSPHSWAAGRRADALIPNGEASHNHHDGASSRAGGGSSGVSPLGMDSVTVEGPRAEWEPGPEGRQGGAAVGGGAINASGDGADGQVDRGAEGGWRRQRGWCLASDERGAGGRFGLGSKANGGVGQSGVSAGGTGNGAGGGRRAGYMSGWMSSVGVWLGVKSVSLEDCLNGFFSAERLRGANQYHCEGCGSKKEADKVMSLLHPPEILVLHVKRFRRGYLWSHKVYNRVTFPLQDLDMSPWMTDLNSAEGRADSRAFHLANLGGGAAAHGVNGGHHQKIPHRQGQGQGDAIGGSGRGPRSGAHDGGVSANMPSSHSRVLYDLVALVQHSGGLEHGHYTCFARDDNSATWYHFNDTLTSRVSPEAVASASPYILIYRRKRPVVSNRVSSVRLDRGAVAPAAAMAAGGAGPGSGPGSGPGPLRDPATSVGGVGGGFSGVFPSSAITTPVSLLASAGIGPAAEEARDVRSRIELMARDMAKVKQRGSRNAAASLSGPKPGGVGVSDGGNGAAGVDGGEGPPRSAISGGGGGISDTDGEGGTGGRSSITRRRKGRGRRPGSESESEGGAGSVSWVYISKAWALKWATSAYPGPVSNHHVVCRHGRVKPNIGVKRAVKEVVAVPRGVHRSLVNRYGPRTPAIAGKAAIGDVGGGARGGASGMTVTPADATAAAVANSGGGGIMSGGLPLVGSSRPLVELASCPACEALEDELARLKNNEQNEVARLSVTEQERRRRRKATRLGRGRNDAVSSGGTECPGAAAARGRKARVAGAGGENAAARDAAKNGGGAEARQSWRLARGRNSLARAGSHERGGSDGAETRQVDDEGGDARAGKERNGSDDEGDEDGYRGETEQNGEEEEEEEEEEEWFLMVASWLKEWQVYVLSGPEEDLDFPSPPPGPITNGDLIDENGKPFPGKNAGKHYRGAVKEVWEFLHGRYGGGPVIRRANPCGLYEDELKGGDSANGRA